jgi:hypothetical protein
MTSIFAYKNSYTKLTNVICKRKQNDVCKKPCRQITVYITKVKFQDIHFTFLNAYDNAQDNRVHLYHLESGILNLLIARSL